MRLAMRDMRCVYVKPPSSERTDEDVYEWEPYGEGMWVHLQPYHEGRIENRQYGQWVSGLLKMYCQGYPGSAQLRLGFGVCVDVRQDEPCDYLVISVEYHRDYVLAVLERIPEPRRKAV